MWWDARIDTKDRGKTIQYEVIPAVKPWTHPKLMASAASTIDVKIPRTEENGIGTYFNRAVVSSQAFVKEFGTNPKGAKRDKALLWLANGMEQVIPAFIMKAKRIDCAIYHLADRNWVIKAMDAYTRPATIIRDVATSVIRDVATYVTLQNATLLAEGLGEAMTRARSLRVAPRAISERTRRSRDTEGSAASIFATRDWLDPMRFASSTWERRFRFLRSFNLLPRATFSST
jgi:hypothetical protein